MRFLCEGLAGSVEPGLEGSVITLGMSRAGNNSSVPGLARESRTASSPGEHP